MVTAKTDNTVLTVTTKPAVAYNGLQRVGDKDFAGAAIGTAAADFTLDVTLQEGDLLEIVETYNNNAANDHVHWGRVISGRGYISYQYPSSNNGLKIQFPSPLTNKIKLNSEGNTNQTLRKIRVWRDAANGFVVPTGTEVRTACTVTCNAGAVNVNGGPEVTAYAGTSMRVSIALPAGQRLDTVTVNNGATVAIADLFTGTVELAVPKGTTGAIVLTAAFTPIVAPVARSIINADGGIAVPCGTIEVRLPASGNRSIQMRSVTGTLTCRAATTWADGGNTANIITSLTTAWTYANSTWNFTTSGHWQDLMFIDQTNNRTYRVRMAIGASYNANQFWIEEMMQ
jgi:putative ubiquitin-RnfH superfamily antitoxin RatB of RatAB toxin-antitoxin module